MVKKAKPFIVLFETEILKFGKKGEKTGWSYIEIPRDIALKLLPGNKKSFRVKGFLDAHPINGIALLPMGKGAFIMPLNAAIRKSIGKIKGDFVVVKLQVDSKKLSISKELIECLENEPDALSFFKSLPKSHQNYFSKWVESAKTSNTKANRIARTLNALSRKMNYGQMLRAGI